MSTRRILGILMSVLGITILAIPGQAADAPKVGNQAPEFTLPAASKDSIMSGGLSLKSQIGKNNIILAFYPADWSGGCTTEMCTMRDNFKELGDLGAIVFGISGDQVFSHREWAKSLNLPFTLLSDNLHDVARTYQSFNPVRGNNLRTVYVIDRQGKIAYIDLDYKAGSAESFTKLKSALQAIRS